LAFSCPTAAGYAAFYPLLITPEVSESIERFAQELPLAAASRLKHSTEVQGVVSSESTARKALPPTLILNIALSTCHESFKLAADENESVYSIPSIPALTVDGRMI